MSPAWKARARGLAAKGLANLIIGAARLLTGARALWTGNAPTPDQTLYFANHNSHADFVLLWATLPAALRPLTRPVAGRDYWLASKLRRFVGEEVFNAVMIRRDSKAEGPDPIVQISEVLQAGSSVIFFPEGTRNTGDEVMLPLRSGLYHLAVACPAVRLVPVWIDNLKRVLPKGALVPIPLACCVHYGAPIALLPGEDKADFLARARQALLDLRPIYDRDPPAERAA